MELDISDLLAYLIPTFVIGASAGYYAALFFFA